MIQAAIFEFFLLTSKRICYQITAIITSTDPIVSEIAHSGFRWIRLQESIKVVTFF